MAAQLIAAMTGSFDPAEYRDEYRAALEQVIEAKVDGREVAEPQAPAAGGQLIDLMAMLEASVSAARTAKSNREVEEAAAAEADDASADREPGAGSKPRARRVKKPAVPAEEVEERDAPARKVARRKTA